MAVGRGMDDGKTTFHDFKKLEVWQQCRDIRRLVWELCKRFPPDEKYRLSDQMIRVSRSPGACIAEGYGRYYYQETIQYCRQARGSLYELLDHTETACDCGFMEGSSANELDSKIRKAINTLNGYIRYLKKKKEADLSN
jgi:four helix bundle protein